MKQGNKKEYSRLNQDRITNAERWDKKFKELLKFKKQFGHFQVPGNLSAYKQLLHWVNSQRKFYKQGKLSRERIRRLKEIGFKFRPYESVWEEMLLELVAFKKLYGHCNVPRHSSPENLKLAGWVRRLREQKAKGKLSQAHIKRLEDIDFIWRRQDAAWENMYNLLLIYRGIFGACNVPWLWEEDPQLANWVFKQRIRKNRGLLKTERIERLNKIGFKWTQY